MDRTPDMEDYCIIDAPNIANNEIVESMQERITRVREDLDNITVFYNISISPDLNKRLRRYYTEELACLRALPFDSYSQQEKVDYLLLKNYLQQRLRQIDLKAEKEKKTAILLPFAGHVIDLCQARQRVEKLNAQQAAQVVDDIIEQITVIKNEIGSHIKTDKTTAFRAAGVVDELCRHLEEWFRFYDGYDPMFTWWVTAPYQAVNVQLKEYAGTIRNRLIQEADSAIVGDPVGRDGLLVELSAEFIPYTPEELLEIGHAEYAWCEAEMKKASHELGYGSDWRKALEYVKTLYVQPGQQPQLVKKLCAEAIEYIKKHDLVTIPPLATETIPMYMMSPKDQLTNPFFLGGDSIIVSYPTSSMSHASKLMSMRGNNIHFSRSTVFHELIPGHHLQLFMNARHRSYRQLFETSFSIEGWAFYWELLLYDSPTFHKSPENKIGMLFWRMHRACRILFSINFHLGKWSPQECIDLLVEKGGHERATAEGEVRRSLNGDYGPLYQAGYMLGALQLYELRRERGEMGEKEFHDFVMRNGQMPIELLRALVKGEELDRDLETSWRFYKGL